MHDLPPRLAALSNLAARLMLAVIYVVAGCGKLAHYAGTAKFIQSLGAPASLLPLVIAVELGGALALVVGYRTRVAALLLAGFTLIAGTLVHLHPGDHENMIVFMDNLAMAGGLLLLAQYGGGALSLDGRRRGG